METIHAAGGYGPPGGGGWGPPGGGGYGAPPPPPGGGYGAPPGAPPAPPGGYGAPPGGGYGSPPAGASGGFDYLPTSAPMMPGAGGDVNTTLPLLLNVMALVMCGATLITAPLSITGIVFAIRAKNAIAAGDVTTARSKAKQSRMAFVGTLLIGLVLIVIWQLLTPSSPPR